MSTLYEWWRDLKFESTEYLKLLNSLLVLAASDFKFEYLCFKNPKNSYKGTSFAILSWPFVFWYFFGRIFVDYSGDAGDAGNATAAVNTGDIDGFCSLTLVVVGIDVVVDPAAPSSFNSIGSSDGIDGDGIDGIGCADSGCGDDESILNIWNALVVSK